MRKPAHIATSRIVCVFSLALLAACAGGKKSPQNPERQSLAEYDLAVDTFHKGQPRQALDHCLKAIELDEENAKALYFASNIYASFCDTVAGFSAPDCHLGEAEKYARMALKVEPNFRDARNMLGQILIHEKKYDEAIAILEPLTRDAAYPDSYKAWGNLGWAQVLKGQLDAGIQSLRNSVTEPRFCVGHYRLGVALEKKGDLAGAEASLNNAVQVEHPNCQNLQDAWEALGRVHVRMNKADEARKEYQKCRDISVESATGKACAKALEVLQK